MGQSFKVLQNILIEPLRVHLYFSNLVFCITSLNHWLGEEVAISFHLNRIERLASKEKRAMTLPERLESCETEITPNTNIHSDSLSHTHNCWRSEPVSTWYGCKARAHFPSSSAGAREIRRNIGRTKQWVYRCQNRYTACNVHDRKLCQPIMYLKKTWHDRAENCITGEKKTILLKQVSWETSFSKE